MKIKILKSKEAQIGALIIVILALFIWGFNFLKGRNILTPSNYLYCEFDDVGGLMESNFVTIRGFKVGLVEDIRLSKDNQSLIVTLVLEDDNVKLPKSSKAVLYSVDMLGTKGVKLEINPGNTYYKSGDTIASYIEKDMLSSLQEQFSPIQQKVESVVTQIDSITLALNTLLSADNIDQVKATIANLNSTSSKINEMVHKQGSALNKTLSNLSTLTATLNDETHGIKPTLKNLNTITDSLATTDLKSTILKIDSTVASLNSILGKIDNNKGSLGNLVNDQVLYKNLSATSESLDMLLNDIQKQPTKYVHVALVDWGKDVYIDDNGVTQKLKESDAYCAILVKTSTNPVDINNDNFPNAPQVNEHKEKNKYYYTIGKYANYNDAKEKLNTLATEYPTAEIVAFKKDKITDLKQLIQ